MNKKILSIALCALLALSGSVLAAEKNEQAADTSENAEEITLRVAITGHESGQIYKVTDEEGNVLRADLGRHGGRMLNRHPFLLTAKIGQDENGELLTLEKVEYNDPPVLIEKPAEKAPAEEVGSSEIIFERDAAYSHALSQSDQKRFYQYNVADIPDEDLANYKKVEISGIANEKAGTKIAFVGSAAATIKKNEIMRFWGGAVKGGHVEVVMNEAYVPLGQRSTVYGTVQEDGRVSLERLDSVA